MCRYKWDLIGAKKPRKKRIGNKNPIRNNLSENEIQTQIIKYLQLNGWITIRINSGASAIDNRYLRMYILNYKGLHTCTSSGLFDIMAFKNNKTICIECKTSKGKVSDAQEKIHSIFRKENFTVIIARDLQDVINYCEK